MCLWREVEVLCGFPCLKARLLACGDYVHMHVWLCLMLISNTCACDWNVGMVDVCVHGTFWSSSQLAPWDAWYPTPCGYVASMEGRRNWISILGSQLLWEINSPECRGICSTLPLNIFLMARRVSFNQPALPQFGVETFSPDADKIQAWPTSRWWGLVLSWWGVFPIASTCCFSQTRANSEWLAGMINYIGCNHLCFSGVIFGLVNALDGASSFSPFLPWHQ